VAHEALFANWRRLADWIADPKNAVPRTYIVTIRGRISEATIERLQRFAEDQGHTLLELAIAGLAYLRNPDSDRIERWLAVAGWGAIIALTVSFRDDMPRGQAMVRAASVPLAVSGLAMLIGGPALERIGAVRATVVGVAALVAMHFVHVAANYATFAGIGLLAAISLATLLTRTTHPPTISPVAAVVLIALAAGHFLFIYVDYASLHRLGPIPASAVILLARLSLAAITVAALVALVPRLARALSERASSSGLVAGVSIGLVAAQLAYFLVDQFTGYPLRFLHAAGVIIAVTTLAMLVQSDRTIRVRVGQIATAGLAGIAAIQFAIFYADYFTGFRVRGSAGRDGNERIVFERVIDETRDRSVPAIYLGWPDALANLYWQFYTTKHHREDLFARTVPALEFNVDRIQALPTGSVVITRPSRGVDAAIDAMTASGGLSRRELLKAPDGTPAYWILETGAGPRAF
jgi:MFS family permease